MKTYFIVLISTLFLFSCHMQKDVDLNLPRYPSQMVVECYLEPGQPFQLCISESVSYLSSPSLPTVDSALVVITCNNQSDTIPFAPYLDPVTSKFYNYRSTSKVPYLYNTTFELKIIDRLGRMATAQTVILPPVPIDTVQMEFNKDSLSYPLTEFTDDRTTVDYYRYVVRKSDVYTGAEWNYITDDGFVQNSKIALGGNYKLHKGTEINVYLYHITKDYYTFLQSVDDARNANGNPFGQPSVIKSNVSGAIGIFAGLSYDVKTLMIK